MTNRQNDREGGIGGRAATSDTPRAQPDPAGAAAGPYHPSSAFRRALRRSRGGLSRGTESRTDRSGSTSLAGELSALAGAALAVGVAAGFLELAVVMIQIHGLHRVGLATLRVSRHAWWMIPAGETVATLGLTLVLAAPALAWSTVRGRRPERSRSPRLARRWTGMVLGTLLFLGPLLAVRRLHAAAALALAIGVGFRAGRLLVRATPQWRRLARRAGVIALGGLVAYSCWEWDRVAHSEDRALALPAPGTPNLLWIVMDTVRADHMSLYGYARPTTPELGRWAAAGITFDSAYSAAPWTLPSHVTMFTGLWPGEHGARLDRSYFGPSPTLAEHLAAHGYVTAGLAANTGMCNATYGVGRGFDYYVELLCNHEVSLRAMMFNAALGARIMRLANALGLPVPAEFPRTGRRLAPELIGHAQNWLGRARGGNQAGARHPFFLFMNFMDAHSPYVPLAASTRRFWTDPLPPRRQSVPETGWRAQQRRDAASADRRPRLQEELDAVVRRLTDLYDDCLLGLDAELGRFLRELRAAGFLDETWVVITADHGEEFGERGIFGHGASLYSRLTHVPLILIPPLGPSGRDDDPYASIRGRRIAAPVSHRNLAATLAGLLVPGTAHPFPGRSLARHWEAGGPVMPDPILIQLEAQGFAGDDVQIDRMQNLDAVIAEGHLLIESVRKASELYNLGADPENRWNLAGQPAQQARQERLKRTLDALRPRPPGASE